METTFKTGVSYFLLFILYAPLFILLYSCFQNNLDSERIYSVIGLLTLCILITLLLTQYKYSISGKILTIKGFPYYKKTIDIDSIRKIEYSRNYMSSPAGSLKRLEIYYNKFDTIVISPKNRPGFIEELIKHNNGIKIVNNL